MQLSDEGVVWNLFYDKESNSVFLKGGDKIFKEKCVPEEIRLRASMEPKFGTFMVLCDGYVVMGAA